MAESDYERARARGKMKQLAGRLLKRHNELASLAEAKNGRVFAGQSRNRVEQVKLLCIVGSINRTRDFDRDFNPLSDSTHARWERVNNAFLNDVLLPPIELQKVGDKYFVRDGHHRVSVARFHGAEYIDAEVIDSICPLEADAFAFV